MKTLVGHSLILMSAGVGALALPFFLERAGTDTSVAGVPEVAVVPSTRASLPPSPSPDEAVPPDRQGLARALQRELRRVGCYQGEITAAWGPQAQGAMRAFTERVNATLPVTEPDDILLRLLRAHRGLACAAPCPAGQAAPGDGHCLPSSITAGGSAPVEPSPNPPSPPSGALLFTQAHGGGHGQDPPPASAVKEHEDSERLAAFTPQGAAPAPPAAPVAPQSQERSAHGHAPSRPAKKPPKIVRFLIRNVQRSLAPLGIP
jgi:hypothetical protein